jgi:hypothetical protein
MLTSIFRLVNKVAAHAADHGTDDLADTDEVDQRGVAEPHWAMDPSGWILGGKRVTRVPTVRTSKLVTRVPVMLVWHWTATPWGTAASIAKRMATYDPAKDRAASTHAFIEHDGSVIQLAPATRGTWCQGGPTAQRFAQDPLAPMVKGRGAPWVPTKKGGVSANALAFSFELVNVGEVKLVNGKWRAWPFEPKSPAVDEIDTVPKGRQRFHRFTTAQVDAAARCTRALVQAYGLRREDCRWTHAQIDPGRKTDPGPVWVEDHLPDVLDFAFRG